MCHVKRKNSYVIYRSIVLYCFVPSFLRLYIRVFDYLLEIIKEDVFGRLQFLDFCTYGNLMVPLGDPYYDV